MVKLVKAAKKQAATPKKKAPPPPKEVEESSEEDSEDEEETPPPKVVKKAAPVKASVKNGKAAAKEESSSEDDDSEEETPPKKAATPAKVPAGKKAKKAEESDEEDESEEEAPPPKKTATPKKPAAKAEESDDDDSEEEAPPPKKTPAKATPVKPAAPAKKAEESDDDEEDDDDESEEEAPPAKKAAPAKAAAKAAPAKEESEDDDDDSDEEEEMDTTPAAPAKKAGMVKAKEESEEEDDDDDDDDDEEEEDDDDDEAAAPAKRKAAAKKDTPPAKKAKSEEGEGFKLFVGNLNSNKDYDELKEAMTKFFAKGGLEIQDVRLGGSKKFGYVDFATEEELQKAMELNGKKLLGMEVKLDRAKSKENSQGDKKERDSRTLFVKNLSYGCSQEDLKEVFDQAVDIRIPKGQNGQNRGIAFIEFKSEAIAEKVMEEAQGSEVQGRSIMLDFIGDKSKQGGKAQQGGGGSASAGKTLVVNNLAYSATEETLQSVFEKAVSIRVPQNNGRAKGFAFVEFEGEDEAKEAMDTLNNTEVEGRTIRLEFSQQSRTKPEFGKGGPTKTLIVKGLSEDTTEESLMESFEGAVTARVVTDRDTGSSKGFGFVDFESEDDCKAAKEAMDSGEIDGTKVTLDYARPKGEGGFGGRGGGGRGGGRGFGGRGGGRGFGGGRGGGRGFGGGRGGGGGRGFGGRGGGGRGGGGGFGKPQGKKTTFDD
ncbi:nucleolin isoform X2 [Clupea harengus]|uniref:Nucleolin n=1 Tax=Clupea harengus TaxID=7950 RepID=A0A6P8G5P9_CLUHA|nr:nucleolin isoform X2 [Clupea harengus]